MSSPFAHIDIHRLADGRLPEATIKTAYKASRRAKIALRLFDDVSPAEIDRLLDPLVAQCRLDIPGLVYLVCAAPDGDTGDDRAPALGAIERMARATRLDETNAA